MTMQRLRTIFASFFKIGLFTFGGGYAMLPLIEQELIAKRGWIERRDGYWILTLEGEEAKVRRDIAPLDLRSLQRAARLYCQLDEVVRAASIQE